MKLTAHRNLSNQKGFTLIELLVVIGILAILLAITLIAINPARQFGNANNTARSSHVTQILNAIGAYHAENRGTLPTDLVGLAADTPTPLNNDNFPTICTELIPDYIPAFPTNPTLNEEDIDADACAAQGTTDWDTGYILSKDANNRITVSAGTDTDNGAVIEVTR